MKEFKFHIIVAVIIVLTNSSVYAGGTDLQSVKLGTFTIEAAVYPEVMEHENFMTGKEFVLETGEITIKRTDGMVIDTFGGGYSSYQYILNDPFTWLPGADGLIYPADEILPLIANGKIAETNFKKFSFFTNKPTTIGLLFGSYGASGGSGQTLLFLDTAGDSYVGINLVDGNEPLWVDKNSKPPIFARTNALYIGGHATAWGYKPRIESVYIFDDGSYRVGQAITYDLFLEKYKEINFTSSEMEFLKNTSFFSKEVDQKRDLGEKMLDFVYYGKKLEKDKEVEKFLSQIHPSYVEEMKYIDMHIF
jgi:hypothetical protein